MKYKSILCYLKGTIMKYKSTLSPWLLQSPGKVGWRSCRRRKAVKHESRRELTSVNTGALIIISSILGGFLKLVIVIVYWAPTLYSNY